MDQWLMRIEGALDAHFIQPDGSSRPGTDWSVGLKRGTDVYSVLVRSYLAPDVLPQVRQDTVYQGQTVMGYLHDLTQQGWTPDQPREHVVVIGNPRTPLPPAKPWWKFW